MYERPPLPTHSGLATRGYRVKPCFKNRNGGWKSGWEGRKELKKGEREKNLGKERRREGEEKGRREHVVLCGLFLFPP